MRRILVLSAVFLMVLAAGPAARADNIAAAGDISQRVGGTRNDQATARLLAPSSGNGIGLVLALGDTQYECGEMENYLGAYDLSFQAGLEADKRPIGRRTSLIVDPPDGRIPAQTAAVKQRTAELREFQLALMQSVELCKERVLKYADGTTYRPGVPYGPVSWFGRRGVPRAPLNCARPLFL